jgi:hypothetical protein
LGGATRVVPPNVSRVENADPREYAENQQADEQQHAGIELIHGS